MLGWNSLHILENDMDIKTILEVSGCAEQNLDFRRRSGGPTQDTFEKILEILAMIRAQKIEQYGDSRLQLVPGDELEAMWMSFGDIHRKYIRLRHQFKTGSERQDLLETLADLTNYSAQAIQILLAIEELK